MSGTWTVTSGTVPIHTSTAPDDGWLVTSHIIELPSRLLVVDAQYALPFAREVVHYAAGLGKPLSRLYVTQYHPDHLLGAAAFDAPLFTLTSVASTIEAAGDRVAREEHEKLGDDIPHVARQPDVRVGEGEETIDGVRVEHRLLRGAETDDGLVVALPESPGSDCPGLGLQPLTLVPRRAPFRRLAHRASGLPGASLRHRAARPWSARRRGAYDEMIEYLDFAEDALAISGGAPQFRQRMISRYPDYRCLKVLDHQLCFLFP